MSVWIRRSYGEPTCVRNDKTTTITARAGYQQLTEQFSSQCSLLFFAWEDRIRVPVKLGNSKKSDWLLETKYGQLNERSKIEL